MSAMFYISKPQFVIDKSQVNWERITKRLKYKHGFYHTHIILGVYKINTSSLNIFSIHVYY